MELRARIRPLPRRAVWMTALVALIASALAAALAPDAFAAKRKAPVVTSVAPTSVSVGAVLTIKGRHFLRGRSRNTVVFKRDGARAVFAKAGLSTRKMMQIRVPGSLQEFFALSAGKPLPTRFRLRVLAGKFGKTFTTDALSPVVSAPVVTKVRAPAPKVDNRVTKPPVTTPVDSDCDGDGTKDKADRDDDNDGLTDDVEVSLSLNTCSADSDGDGLADKWEFDCDRDGVLNRDQADDDADLLSDKTETAIGTDPCKLDTDEDGVEDGYEYRSARDLNDDEYQDPNKYLPYPAKRPYPNPLFKDAEIDYDGDSLTLATEQALWKYTYEVNHSSKRATNLMDQSERLSYSDGAQYSIYSLDSGRRKPALAAAGYSMQTKFLEDAEAHGYGLVYVRGSLRDVRDSNLDGTVSPSEELYYDFPEPGTGLPNGWLSDDERDEDADGLTNYDEAVGRITSAYWAACYSEKPYRITYAGTNLVDPDSDGDHVVRDGADDQDHDDVPNLMELSREAAVASRLRDGSCGKPGGTPNPLPVEGRVNPYNPCLPYVDSRTCDRHPLLDNLYAPFDDATPGAYLILN